MQGIFDACGFADSIAKGTEMQQWEDGDSRTCKVRRSAKKKHLI